MHYTIKIKSPQQAVQETREWLGDRRFELFVTELRRGSGDWSAARRLRSLYGYLGLAGVSGRCVIHAMYKYVWM